MTSSLPQRNKVFEVAIQWYRPGGLGKGDLSAHVPEHSASLTSRLHNFVNFNGFLQMKC